MWSLEKTSQEDANKVHPLTNLKEISFGQFFCAPEEHRQLDYHKISAPENFKGTRLSLLNLFSNCSPSTYFVQLNVDPSADLARRVVAVHTKKQ